MLKVRSLASFNESVIPTYTIPSLCLKCNKDANHTFKITTFLVIGNDYMCLECMSDQKKVLLKDAISYNRRNYKCHNNVDCSNNLFKTSCGHIMCDKCIIKYFTQITSNVNTHKNKNEMYSSFFMKDLESFLVPPCPICFGKSDKTGTFNVRTLCMLPRVVFSKLKKMANLALTFRDNKKIQTMNYTIKDVNSILPAEYLISESAFISPEGFLLRPTEKDED